MEELTEIGNVFCTFPNFSMMRQKSGLTGMYYMSEGPNYCGHSRKW